MKKSMYFLFLFLINTGIIAQSSNGASHTPRNIQPSAKSRLASSFIKKQVQINKAPNDTVYYQDFANNLPSGWSIVNNHTNNFQWTWDTVYSIGRFTNGFNAIQSTTASNGFMTLNSDFYNTPTPITGAIQMNTYFQSDSIDLTKGGLSPGGLPSVWLSYQQFLVYCCNPANRLVLQVSVDNFTTLTEFDATDGLPINQTNTPNSVGGQSNLINISSVAANQTHIQIRFLSFGNTQYFWMIDDLAIIEGWPNEIELDKARLEFNPSRSDFRPSYGQIPYQLISSLPFSGTVINNGYNNQTNVVLDVDVTHQTYPNNTPGLGLVYSTMSTPISVLNAYTDSSVSTNSPHFTPLQLGNYQVDFLASSDSIDQKPGNESKTLNFSITDTVFARDDGSFEGVTGTGSFTKLGVPGGTAVSDKFGVAYIVEPNSGSGFHTIPTSVTFMISSAITNIAVEILPKIWKYDPSTTSVFTEVASSFIPYTVTALATTLPSITLPFDNGPAVTLGLDSGKYIVGWQVTKIAGGTNFEVLNDETNLENQDSLSCYINFGHSPGWELVKANPGIRLNFGNTISGIKNTGESNLSLSINPNPSTGKFQLKLSNSKSNQSKVIIRNSLGQITYTSMLKLNNNSVEEINLSQLAKGLYFVQVENDFGRSIKKVLIQ